MKKSIWGCLLLAFLVQAKKQNCGSAADGALNMMTLSVVSSAIIINIINAANNNNNNRNNNNNNNNNNDQNENDNTFMITVSNTNQRRSLSSIFSPVHELLGNSYGARYPWKFRLLNETSKYYDAITNGAKDCVLKSVCEMAAKRQAWPDNSLNRSIFKTVSLYVTLVLYRQLSFKKEAILEAIQSSQNCSSAYSLCPLE